jgi:hypothetical protein
MGEVNECLLDLEPQISLHIDGLFSFGGGDGDRDQENGGTF